MYMSVHKYMHVIANNGILNSWINVNSPNNTDICSKKTLCGHGKFNFYQPKQ